jgi:hypothetical protein
MLDGAGDPSARHRGGGGGGGSAGGAIASSGSSDFFAGDDEDVGMMRRMPVASYSSLHASGSSSIRPDSGLGRKGCFRFLKVGLVVMAVALALLRLGSIDRRLGGLGEGEGLDLRALKPTLQSHDTDFGLVAYTSVVASKVLLLKLNEETLLAESPQLLLFSATFASGTLLNDVPVSLLNYAAENTDRTVFYFRLSQDLAAVDLYRRQLTLRTTDESMEVSLAGSAPDEWVTSLPVVAMEGGQGDGGLEFTALATALLENGFYITELSPASLVDLRLQLSTVRSFPRNMDLTVEYEVVADERGTTVPMAVRFSLAALPLEPMSGRLKDERIGYFSTVYWDVGDHDGQVSGKVGASLRRSSLLDPSIELINRRRMSRKAPLLYHVDPSVPERWRQALKRGVETWQPAFEAAGWGPAAIRCVLPGERDWPEDYDAADIRFNSITWAVDTEEVFAIGPSTIDPRSGEILRSNIVFTNGWVDYWVVEHERIGHDDHLNRNGLHSHEHGRHVPGLCLQERLAALKASGISAWALKSRVAAAAKQGGGEADEIAILEDLISQGLTDVTMHEVGHTLGLRHNFQGSTSLTLQQAQDRAYTSEHGLTSSVMDYLPVNVVSLKAGGSQDADYFPRAVGAYDMWAIEYGYMELDGLQEGAPEPLLFQHPQLKAIADRAMRFSTDEDVPDETGFDPRSSLFDLGSDPLAFYEDKLDLVQELRATLLDRSVRLGESFTRYANAEYGMLRELYRAGTYASKYIGGFHVSKQRKVEAGAAGPLAPVPAEDQRRALAFLVRLLTDDVSVSPAADRIEYLINKSGACSGLEQDCFGREPFDVAATIDRLRQGLILNLLSAERIDRLRLQSWAQGDGGATAVSAVLNELTHAIWGDELYSSDRAADSKNWGLMLFWTDVLMSLADTLGTPQDVSAAAHGEVYRIRRSVPDLSTIEPSEITWSLATTLTKRVLTWEEGETRDIIIQSQ